MSDIKGVVSEAPSLSNLSDEDQTWLFENFQHLIDHLQKGVSGTFTTVDSKTVTVENGIIIAIV